jgi:hypothetical protein
VNAHKYAVASVLALFAAFAVVAFSADRGVFADGPNEDAATKATVGGGTGVNIKIECKWELPDMTAGDLVMTYGSPTPNDDAPTTLADAPACTPPNAAANLRRHMMQVRPNPGDLAIKRQYEKWVALEPTPSTLTDIVDVFFKVWEPYVPSPPNGPNCASPLTFATDTGSETAQYCFKYQHHATANLLPPTAANPLTPVSCATLQALQSTMFQAAINTGQMTAAERDDIVLRVCQGEKAVYRVQEEISKDQPCGEYRVEMTAVNSAGATFKNVNFFDVICFVYLLADFDEVDWGTIPNNQTTVLSGDFCFEGLETSCPTQQATASDSKPTVINYGNQPLYLEIHYFPLVFTPDPTKQITVFDAKLLAEHNLSNPSSIEIIDPLNASQWYCFGVQPIGSNQEGKLDLSVHPTNAQAGDYTGSVNLLARANCVAPHTGVHTHP